VLVEALASYRLTRLLQKDAFPPAKWVRDKVEDRGGKVAELWECPWCLGMWTSLLVVTIVRRKPDVVRALAINVFVGVMREVEEVVEERWL
jgi:hypothetical protein